MFANMPIDIKSIEPKLLLGLTKRQLICGAIAIIPASLGFLLFNFLLGKDIAMYAAIIFACPGFALMVYKKNGMPAEQVAKAYVKWKFLHPQIYKTKIDKKNKSILKRRGII